MKKHSIVNLKYPCFLFRYPNLDIPSQALSNLHIASAFPLKAVVKTTNIFKALQATQRDLPHGAVTLSSQFSTVHDAFDCASCRATSFRGVVHTHTLCMCVALL